MNENVELLTGFNRVMENSLIIVHRSLRPHPIRRHTPTISAPKSPTALTPVPNSPPGHQESEKGASFTFLVPQQKAQSRGKPHLGTPEGRNSENIHLEFTVEKKSVPSLDLPFDTVMTELKLFHVTEKKCTMLDKISR